MPEPGKRKGGGSMTEQIAFLIIAFIAGTIAGACGIFALLVWISARAMLEEKESKSLVKRGKDDEHNDA